MRFDVYHCKNTSNAGDRAAPPTNYLRLGPDWDLHDVDKRPVTAKSQVAIIGGGGLIQHYLSMGVQDAMAKHGVNILWSIGLNGEDVRGDSYRKHPWVDAADLVGVRDWGPDVRYRWLPCPSCMHLIFDTAGESIAPVHEYVMYTHCHHPFAVHHRILEDIVGHPVAPMPKMGNMGCDIEDAVEFLASGKRVLTSSYHGAYWATLLGREVVVVRPWSSKFMRLRFPPTIVDDVTYGFEAVRYARKYPEALQECRQTTLAFADDVRILLRSIS